MGASLGLLSGDSSSRIRFGFVQVHLGVLQVLFMSDRQLLDMRQRAEFGRVPPDEWGAYSTPAQTIVIGSHLGAPCNCATASPDGQWIAAVGDQPVLHILHICEGYGMALGPKARAKKQGHSKGAVLKFGAKQPTEPSPNNSFQDTARGWSVWAQVTNLSCECLSLNAL